MGTIPPGGNENAALIVANSDKLDRDKLSTGTRKSANFDISRHIGDIVIVAQLAGGFSVRNIFRALSILT